MNFDEQQSLDALEILSFSAALDSGIVPRFFFFRVAASISLHAAPIEPTGTFDRFD